MISKCSIFSHILVEKRLRFWTSTPILEITHFFPHQYNKFIQNETPTSSFLAGPLGSFIETIENFGSPSIFHFFEKVCVKTLSILPLLDVFVR